MLPKNRRLNKELIKALIKQIQTIRLGNISLKYSIISNRPTSFTFVVPIKTAKKAVWRNKLKRRARAIVRQLLPGLKNNISAIIFFQKGSAEMKFPEIEQEIEYLFRKAGLFK